MSHFAQLNEENIVTQVIVGPSDMDDYRGLFWCEQNLGGRWIQTSYNAKIRKNFAGISYLYDPVLDAFVAPQPFSSWYLNEETCQWEAPIDYPTDGPLYTWDESAQSWNLIL